ncbi:hypothetical protein B0H19DRAFT_327400 [Mycena capillaripes]|nr:hypothetical protein B0H19DRAFT_327400 [Mycena capillaripes]
MDSATSMRVVFLEQTARTSESSKAQIKQFIEESDSNFTSLDTEVTSLEAEIAVLKARLAAVAQLRDRERATSIALRSLLAPIRTLPIELMTEIFRLTIHDGPLPVDHHSSDYTRPLHFKDALRVSHVCSDWRRVVNSTPQLWSGPVGIDLSRDSSRMRQDTDFVMAWLALSAPLSIPLSLVGFRNVKVDVLPPVLKEVMRTTSRWRSLQVRDTAPPSFFQRLAELDNLEELILPQDALILELGPTPRLQNLTMTPNRHVLMPWAQLTNLKLLDGGSADGSLDILAQCKNLITVAVSTFGCAGSTARTDIPLNHLRTFVLDFYMPEIDPHFTPFLATVSAPALEKLTLDLARTFIWTETQFTAFQLHSPNITHLEVRFSGLTSDDLKAALRHAPSLTYLAIVQCPHCIDSVLLSNLMYTDSEALVPRLHDLTLLGINPSLETMLAVMIQSRWQTAPDKVARWTRIKLRTEYRLRFSPRFLQAIKTCIPPDVLLLL